MARVFLGVAHGPGGATRAVVIKRLREHLASNVEAVRRFLNEGELHAHVRHPNVVAIYEVGRDEGGLFIALEWVDGASLKALAERALRRGGRLDPRVAARIVVDALRGLSAAHRACDGDGQPLGILHRDATPDNILVGRDGRARLTDFGVAKCRDGKNLTDRGMVVGKMDYIAPEYLDRRPVDARMDVYAMGVTAWVSLAGKRPFGNELGLSDEMFTRRVPELDERAAVSRAVASVVQRACRHDPRDRFPSAAAMADALEQAAAATDALATHVEVGAVVTTLLSPHSSRPPSRTSSRRAGP